MWYFMHLQHVFASLSIIAPCESKNPLKCHLMTGEGHRQGHTVHSLSQNSSWEIYPLE